MQDGDGTTTTGGKGAKGKGKEKGGSDDVRDGNGARITLNRDEGMDLLAADLGDLFNVSSFDLFSLPYTCPRTTIRQYEHL